MFQSKKYKRMVYAFSAFCLSIVFAMLVKTQVNAVNFPGIIVSFDTADEAVIVEGIPAGSADGSVEYQVEGYLNYESERIETFCYAPKVMAYHVPDKMAYIFQWSGDKERFLPCTGEYSFTAFVTARYKDAQGKMIEEKGPKTTILITLHKKDESTNWGPGLPNTTVETYDLNQIKGTEKTIVVEEDDYTWTIHGKDIVKVPDVNVSLKIIADSELFQDAGVDEFFGNTVAAKISIEHNGDFGFQALLDYKLGEQYAGKYANLFFVAGNREFEYMESSLVGDDGIASFVYSHASDYVIAITEVEYTGQQLNDFKVIETQESVETSVEESLETSVEESLEASVEESLEVSEEKPLEKESLEETTKEQSDSETMGIAVENNFPVIMMIFALGIVFIVLIILKMKKKS